MEKIKSKITTLLLEFWSIVIMFFTLSSLLFTTVLFVLTGVFHIIIFILCEISMWLYVTLKHKIKKKFIKLTLKIDSDGRSNTG